MINKKVMLSCFILISVTLLNNLNVTEGIFCTIEYHLQNSRRLIVLQPNHTSHLTCPSALWANNRGFATFYRELRNNLYGDRC